MNSGSHLTALRRTKIGDYNVIDATDVTLFEDQFNHDVNYRISYFVILYHFVSAFKIKNLPTPNLIQLRLTGNPNRDEVNPYTNKNNLFFYRKELGQNLVMVFTIINGLQLGCTVV
jgi:hypothetical protein